jgi:integrase
MEGQAIRLRHSESKNRHSRVVMLQGALKDIIDRRWAARLVERDGVPRVSELVFHLQGRHLGDFRRSWKSACNATGVPGRRFHDLRRSAIRNLVRAGVPEVVCMAISGHRTRAIFDRYNISSEDDLREAAQKVTLYLDTLPTSRSTVALPGSCS